MKWWDRRNILLLITSCVLTAAVAEVGLRVGTAFPIHGTGANRIADPQLGYRMSPRLRGIDSFGFRNSSRPARADIIALGDSHTFGYNVDAGQNWPSQLSRLTGRSVYNLGIGGYGAYQYRALLGEVLEMRPRTVVVGVYVLNDAADLCASQAFVADRQSWEHVTGISWESCSTFGSGLGTSARGSNRLSEWTSSRSALVSLTRWVYGHFRMKGALDAGTDLREGRIVVRDASGGRYLFRTSTTRGRERLVDPEAADVRLGMSQLLAFFSDAVHELRAANAELVVLCIPIRERVFAEALTRSGQGTEFATMLHREGRLAQALAQQLAELGIARADVLPDLLAAQVRGERIYPDGEDDHPTEVGYRAYAQAARRLIR